MTTPLPSSAPEERLTLPATLGAMAELEAFARRAATRAGLHDEAADDLALALVEAGNNVVEHGYAQAGGTLSASAWSQAGTLVVLEDSGRPVPSGSFDNPLLPADESARGRGLAIIRACVDAVDYRSEDGVNRLILHKRA